MLANLFKKKIARLSSQGRQTVRGLLTSTVGHLLLIVLVGAMPLTLVLELTHSLPRRDKSSATSESPRLAAQALASSAWPMSPAEQRLAWTRPLFQAAELGPALSQAQGQQLTTHAGRSAALQAPAFTPYVPPPLAELAIDPDHDVLRRHQPARDDGAGWRAQQRRFHTALARDLADCRLDQISLEEAVLRLRYFRLQQELQAQGRQPAFSYEQVRAELRRKLALIHDQVAQASAASWPQALLLAFRQDKIYEERRGQSLFNSIYYDIYNCRSGTEELLIYLSRYHPELQLATVRGSVLKYDGTLMGHMDPAVKIDGRWQVFKTVALDTVLVEEYRVGELYRLEKVVLDYLPELASSACPFATPLARNGEPLRGRYESYPQADHPLSVKDRQPSIVLWRESSPTTAAFRMMNRQDRLLHQMLVNYQPLNSERQLLNDDDPFADLLFHFLQAPVAERQPLLDLYLHKRVNSFPRPFKRPLRQARYLPGYGDLLSTLAQEKQVKLEVLPNQLVPLQQFVSHAIYRQQFAQRRQQLTSPAPLPAKKIMATELSNFLFSAPGQGVSAIFPPVVDGQGLVSDLFNGAYQLPFHGEAELRRRANGSSGRAIAIVKAGLLTDHQTVQLKLDERMELLRQVLSHTQVTAGSSGLGKAHELPASLSYAATVALGGKQGLSPGFIRDMVELLGEEEALQGLDGYLAEQSGLLQLSRQATAELFAYADSYLLLAKSKKGLRKLAQQLYDSQAPLASRVGAAQFLVQAGELKGEQVSSLYASYLEKAAFDVQELASLLSTGLSQQQARTLLHTKINDLALQGLTTWSGGDQQGLLAEIDELQRGSRLLLDQAASLALSQKLTARLEDVFVLGGSADDQLRPHYGHGLSLLSVLARSGQEPADELFGRFIDFGSQDPVAFFFAQLMSSWFGQERYQRLLADQLKQQHKKWQQALLALASSGNRGITVQRRADIPALQQWLVDYERCLQELANQVARYTFIHGLLYLQGQQQEAGQGQSVLLARLFEQQEFTREYETRVGPEVLALRDRTLLKEGLFRAVELAAFMHSKNSEAGILALNHAPTIVISGEFLSACGPMARLVDGRNRPDNILFTRAGTYFDSLLDAKNSPKRAAQAFEQENSLRQLLSNVIMTPETAEQLAKTEQFFRQLASSNFCDIRRLYVLEKLLKRAVLPERLPEWILQLASDSHHQEMAYLARISQAGGVAAIFDDYQHLSQQQFQQRWGEQPFSIRNLYGTLVLVKMGRLQLNEKGHFVAKP